METIIGHEFPKKVIPLIENAKNNIRIVVFDWRWYPDDPANPVSLFNQALIRACRRGVDVSALVNFPALCDLLKKLDIKSKKLSSKNILHAKFITIDNSVYVLGSHNFSQNAFTTNFEVSLTDYSEDIAQNLNKFFDSLWQL